MKRISLVMIFAFSSLVAFSQPAKHVVLISIDGLRPEFYLDHSWQAPNLQQLMKAGVYSKGVKSVFPSITYPAHTTITTGAYPSRHGVYYNGPRDGKKGQGYWDDSLIKVSTLWDAVKQAKLTSGAVMWPVTVGAPIDYNFPVKRPANNEASDQIKVTRPVVTPAGLLDEIEMNATGPLTMADFNADNTVDITIGKMGAYIFKTYRPNLMALHFITVDHLSHDHGKNDDKVRKGVALIDSMIGVVMKTIKEAGVEKNTTIIITGDHGFVNSTAIFSPNVLLQQHGLFTGNDGTAFYGTGGSTFLYVKNNNELATVKKIKALLNALPGEHKKAFRIVDRAELDKIGANPEVAFALALAEGYVATNDAKGELFRTKKKGATHGYYPDFDEISTGFIAAGAGIAGHKEIKSMGIKDVAPLISELLDLSFKTPDGVLIPGILKN